MTPQQIIHKMETQGYSMGQIANELKRTRGSIAGAIHRYRKKHSIKAHGVRIGKEWQREEINLIKGIDDFMAVIEEKRCRYIKGDLRRNPIFCKNKAEKKYYCEDHFNTCHRRAESKNEK